MCRDGQRLFFGYQWIDPVLEKRRLEQQAEKREERARKEREKAADAVGHDEEDGADEADDNDEPYDPLDFDALLDERKLDVWHGNDPYIIPHQKKQWKETEKDRVLDYSIKMKQFFDHYLKGEPAPAWMTEGVPYRGE